MNSSPVCLCCQRRPLLQGMAVLLLSPGLALAQDGGREGVEVGGNSVFSRLVPAETIESSSAQQYAEMLQQAAAQNALGGKNHPQVKRLRAIAQRIIPHAMGWNPRAKDWRWEVNLIGSRQVNAFCMPGVVK